MKPFTLLIACLIGFNLNAQKYGLSIESGPSIGVLKKDLGDAAFSHQNSYSLGGGIAHNLLLHIYPDSSNWYFVTGFELFQSNQSTTAFADIDSTGYFANARSMNAFRFQTQLAYSFGIGKFRLDLRAGLIVPLLGSSNEYQYHKDSTYNSMTIVSLKNYPSLGFKGGVNFSGPLTSTSRWRWFVNLDITLMNAKVKNSKVIYYKDTEGRELESIYPDNASREIEYRKDPNLIRNNEAVLPARFDKNLPTDKLTYTQSINSVNFRVGFLFQF